MAVWKDARAGSLNRSLGSQLGPVAYDAELLPEVRTILAYGRTPGHMAVLLSSGDEWLL